MPHSLIPSLDYGRTGRKPGLLRYVIIVAGILAGLSVLGACFSHLGALFLLLYMSIFNRPIPFDQRAARFVVTQVTNGALNPDVNGVVKLPPRSKDTSLNGEVYVTKDSSGTVWVLFRTWQGKWANLQGYLYRSTPAAGPAPPIINVLGPIPLPTPTQENDYFVDRQIDPNWYQIHRDQD
jgi:hypothetical protein